MRYSNDSTSPGASRFRPSNVCECYVSSRTLDVILLHLLTSADLLSRQASKRVLSPRRSASPSNSVGGGAVTSTTFPPSSSSAPSLLDSVGSDAEPTSRPTSIKKRFTQSWAQKRRSSDDGGPRGLQILHASPEPLVDLIFVHGLRGGSVKTWRKGNDPRLFWPQYWLPREAGFHNTNIHTFGYESDWASTKSSILDVHDFGRSLLEEM